MESETPEPATPAVVVFPSDMTMPQILSDSAWRSMGESGGIVVIRRASLGLDPAGSA